MSVVAAVPDLGMCCSALLSRGFHKGASTYFNFMKKSWPFCILNMFKLNKKITYNVNKKDDRAMRHIWMPWKISESLATPTATFPEIVNGLLLWSIVWKCVQNLKFVALPVPEIIGGTQKLWAVPGSPRALISKIFNGLLFGYVGPMNAEPYIWLCMNVSAKFEVRSITRTVPEITVGT